MEENKGDSSEEEEEDVEESSGDEELASSDEEDGEEDEEEESVDDAEVANATADKLPGQSSGTHSTATPLDVMFNIGQLVRVCVISLDQTMSLDMVGTRRYAAMYCWRVCNALTVLRTDRGKSIELSMKPSRLNRLSLSALSVGSVRTAGIWLDLR